MLESLRGEGFSAEATSFSPTGFRTDAPAADVYRVVSSAKSHAHKI
jgi:tRNA G26 N,N-dimethylase Trm1